MKDSAGIKRDNKAQIRKLLVCGKPYTKQQIALQTGLSVASCNTYLNEMEMTGEVIGEKQKLHDVGRNAVVYKLNEDFESILCIYFELIQGIKSIEAAVFSPIGRLLNQQTRQYEILDYTVIEREVAELLEQFPNASRIMVGTPSIAENGVIRHSDILELENVPLRARLEEEFQLPVFLSNDMHYKVYGYYRQEQISDKIVTLINYPAGVLPGTATVPQRGFANWEEFVCRYGWFSGLRDESRAAGETTASPHGGAFNYSSCDCTDFHFEPS